MKKTANNPAAIVRAALKSEQSWNRNHVSVRTSGGCSVDVTIKCASVDFATVLEIAERVQRVDRDGWGEILSGGNTFVFVSYSDGLRKEFSAKHAEAAQKAIDDLEAKGRKSSVLLEIEGTTTLIGHAMHSGYALWREDKHIAGAYGGAMHVSSADAASLYCEIYARENKQTKKATA